MTDEWEELLSYERYTEIDGNQTHYLDGGDGKPVFLIHGGLVTSCGELNWGAVFLPLVEHCRVIAPDQPGFGFTDLRDENDYLQQFRADYLIELIEQLELEDVTVAGNSEGGSSAQYIALERPDLVEKLVIVNSRTPRPGEPSGDASLSEPNPAEARQTLEAMRESNFDDYEAHPFFRDPITEEKVDRFREILQRNWPNANGRANMKMDANDDRRLYRGKIIDMWAPEIDKPTLLTWSTNPEVFPRVHYSGNRERLREIEEYFGDMDQLDSARWMLEEMPNAELHVWHGGRHQVMTDQAPRWVDVVQNFVNSDNT